MVQVAFVCISMGAWLIFLSTINETFTRAIKFWLAESRTENLNYE